MSARTESREKELVNMTIPTVPATITKDRGGHDRDRHGAGAVVDVHVHIRLRARARARNCP
jgi:hypothetical protein